MPQQLVSSNYGSATRYARRIPYSAVGRYAARRLGGAALRALPVVGNAMAAYEVGRGLYGAGRRLFSRGTQTPTRSVRRRYGAGRWTGYVKRKPIKRKAKRRVKQMANNSYMLSVEKSGTQAPTIAAVLGHSTISRTYALRALFGALLRLVMYRGGMKASSPSANVTPLVTGTVIGVEFQYGQATNDGMSINITAPASFTVILDAFITAFNTKYDALSATVVPYDLRLRNVYITNSSAVAGSPQVITLDLVNARIMVACNSKLKIQNRSVNTAGDDDANDVDNVPINVLSYSGYGTGLDSRYDFLGLGFNANQDCIIATSDPPLAGDAPLPALLDGVKKSGFTRIQPGGIKTDIITHKIYMSLDTYCRHVITPRGNNNVRLPIGKFSFCHYEKTLEANNAAPVAMAIAYENQLTLTGKIILRTPDLPIPEFIRN